MFLVLSSTIRSRQSMSHRQYLRRDFMVRRLWLSPVAAQKPPSLEARLNSHEACVLSPKRAWKDGSKLRKQGGERDLDGPSSPGTLLRLRAAPDEVRCVRSKRLELTIKNRALKLVRSSDGVAFERRPPDHGWLAASEAALRGVRTRQASLPSRADGSRASPTPIHRARTARTTVESLPFVKACSPSAGVGGIGPRPHRNTPRPGGLECAIACIRD